MLNQNKRYYCSLWFLLVRLLPIILILLTIGTPFVYYLFQGRGPFHPNSLQVLAATLITGSFTLVIAVYIYNRFFPVTITPEFLIGHNKSGKKTKLRWPEIVNTGLVGNFGFPCYQLTSKTSGNYILIPSFLSRFEQCKKDLKDHGVDLLVTKSLVLDRDGEKRSTKKTKPSHIKSEPIREGNYIIITTERERSR